jgi:hypothetical protein
MPGQLQIASTLDEIAFPIVYRIAKALLNFSSPIFVVEIMKMGTSRGEPYLRAEKVTKLG